MSKTKLETVKVTERGERGKGPSRRLRVAGKVPGIYYDQKGANIMIQVDRLPLEKAWLRFGSSRVVNLEIDRTDGAAETCPALIWRIKNEPVKGSPIHVDFFGVDLDKEIRVSVPFEVSGTAKGVKDGGILQMFRESIEVHCKPLDIPEAIVIDVTALDINENIAIDKVVFPEGVTPYYDQADGAFAVVGVSAPMSEADLTASLEGGAAAPVEAEKEAAE